MGWFDKLKDWAEDKVDDVEDELGDAGNWLKDKAEDIAGDNPWAKKIIDKIDDYVPERRGDRRQGHGRRRPTTSVARSRARGPRTP